MVDENDRIGRRTVTGAVAAGVASLAGCGNPLSDAGGGNGDGENGTDAGDSGGGQVLEGGTIRLGARTEHWVGQEPESIADQENPTLRLQADTTYEIVWENLDGEEHELMILDAGEAELEASESSSSQGETRSLEFTAASEMAVYICEYHPDSMRSEIDVRGG